MKVHLTGQFLERGQFKRKDDSLCEFTTLLIGATAQQVTGLVVPRDTKYLDTIECDVDIRAYNGNLICNAI